MNFNYLSSILIHIIIHVTCGIRPLFSIEIEEHQIICRDLFNSECLQVPYFEIRNNCSCSVYGFETPPCADLMFNQSVGLNLDVTIDINSLVRETPTSLWEAFMTYLVHHSKCGVIHSTQGDQNLALIQSCPNGSDTVQKNRCENPTPNLPPIEYRGNIPLLFKNVHCALCQGLNRDFIETKMDPWPSQISCKDNVTITDWQLFQKKILSGECWIYFDLPIRPNNRDSQFCHQPFKSSLYRILTNECTSCDQSDVAVQMDCFLCQFAITVSEEYCYNNACTGEMCLSLSSLFQIPSDDEIRVRINGGFFKSSEICKDDEQFDILLQSCRQFICSPFEYPSKGMCIENTTLYIPSESQPLPNGSNYLFLTIKYNISLLVSSSNSFDGPITFSLENFLHKMSKLFNLIGSRNLTYERNGEMNTVVLVFDTDNKSTRDILENIGNIKISKSAHVVLEIRNFLNKNTSGSPCDEVTCTYNPDLFFERSLLFAKVKSMNKTMLFPIDNILYNLSVAYPSKNMSLVEICTCEIDFESILNCSSITFKYAPGEFVTNDDGILEVPHLKIQFQKSEYRIKDGKAFVCYTPETTERFFNMDATQAYVSWICSGLSMVALLITVILFCMFPELRNLPGKLILGLAISLIFGQGLLLIPQIGDVCRYLATVTHFSWLSAFMWMGAQAVNMLLTFHPKTMHGSYGSSSWHGDSTFKRYCSICLLIPGIFCLTLLILDIVPGNHLHVKYGLLACSWLSDFYGYIFMFYVPVGIILVLNIVCFSLTLYYIEHTMSMTDKVTGRKRDKARCVIYIKLSSVMGFSWVFGFIASFSKVASLWYVYIVLNGLQGLFIFFSFSLNSRTRKMVARRLAVSRGSKYRANTIQLNTSSSAVSTVTASCIERTNTVPATESSKTDLSTTASRME